MVEEIAIDTNILLRFISGDDAEQFERALTLFAHHSVWISNTVLVETEWVLRKGMHYTREELVTAYEALLDLEGVTFEDETSFANAINATKEGMDFADSMHLYVAKANFLPFHSFDKTLVKRANQLKATAHLA